MSSTSMSHILREGMWLVSLSQNGFLLLLFSPKSLAKYYILWSQSFTSFSSQNLVGIISESSGIY